jgi:hypothetical protein
LTADEITQLTKRPSRIDLLETKENNKQFSSDLIVVSGSASLFSDKRNVNVWGGCRQVKNVGK